METTALQRDVITLDVVVNDDAVNKSDAAVVVNCLFYSRGLAYNAWDDTPLPNGPAWAQPDNNGESTVYLPVPKENLREARELSANTQGWLTLYQEEMGEVLGLLQNARLHRKGYQRLVKAERKAIEKVREVMTLTNRDLMIPVHFQPVLLDMQSTTERRLQEAGRKIAVMATTMDFPREVVQYAPSEYQPTQDQGKLQ